MSPAVIPLWWEELCILIVIFSPYFHVDHFHHFGAVESLGCSLVALQVLLQFGCSSFWWPANEPAGEQCTQVLTSKDKGQNQKYCTGAVVLVLQNCCHDTRMQMNSTKVHKCSFIFSSVRSSYSHPDLLLIHPPTFSDHTGPQHWTFTFWATTAI